MVSEHIQTTMGSENWKCSLQHMPQNRLHKVSKNWHKPFSPVAGKSPKRAAYITTIQQEVTRSRICNGKVSLASRGDIAATHSWVPHSFEDTGCILEMFRDPPCEQKPLSCVQSGGSNFLPAAFSQIP